MLDMQLPWWEFILRGAVVYSALLMMVRLSGKRTIGQSTPFDLLVIMLLSEAVSNSLSGSDDSLAGGLLIAATLIVLNAGASFVTSRSRKIEKLLEGEAVLLGRDGRLFTDAIKNSQVSIADMEAALRAADCDLDNLKCAFLEPNGEISVMKKE